MAHQAKVITPLGDDVLQLRQMSGSEGLSQLFVFELTLYSTDEEIKANKLLGQNVTVQLETREETLRYFNGFISQFSYLNQSEDGQAVYQATVRPWLWFLTRTSDCKIYQDMTVVEIVKSVFSDNGFSSDLKDVLIGNYRKWAYCVQYRETDFNFVSRLMEQEGIYYYFEHQEASHKLVLIDDLSSHGEISGNPELPFHQPGVGETVDTEHISDWQLRYGVQPDRVMLADYNFKTPKKSLRVEKEIERDHAKKGNEIFDYPGEYTTEGEGGLYSEIRLDEFSTNFEQVSGTTDARNLATGELFSLIGHPRKDQDRAYLVVSAQYDISLGLYSSGAGGNGPIFSCRFSAMDSKLQYRPPRKTVTPIVQGPQTAFVVGNAGEEISPDEYGRVKVQFHWDRNGENDERSSCWIRVAQSLSGTGWGAQFIPRIGHEVIVDFLEGDPDRPIVTGSVYNAMNMPPYSLPDNKTQSGIKSRSTLNGTSSNFNEIRLEDKKGSEEFYVQAEKDYNQLVKNDRSETIGHDRALNVGNDKSESVENNKSIQIGVDHSETIGNNKTLTVGVNHTESIGSNMAITIGSTLTENVGINYSENVGAAMELTVGAAMVETVGANKIQSIGSNKTQTIGSSKTQTIGSNMTVSVGKDSSESIGGDKSVSVEKDEAVTVGKKFTLEAGDEITLKTGDASIQMKKDGSITIQGKDITIKGSGGINVKASKNVVLKGKKIIEN